MIDKFDDLIQNEDGSYWSQICTSCVEALEVNKEHLDNAGEGICGVTSCSNEAEFYIDFK